MRKLIIAAAAIALMSSTAFAQDKTGGAAGTSAQSGDTMSKGDNMKMGKTKKKSKKSSKSSGDEMKQ